MLRFMKPSLLPALIVSLALASGAFAQSTVEKAETKIKDAAEATGNAVKNAAEKTGEVLKKAGEKTEQAVKSAAHKVEEKGKSAGEKADTDAHEADHKVTETPLYKKIETELGRPFTPEERQKYSKALKKAKDKVKDAGEDFAEKVSEITGVAESKTKAFVKEHGL